MKKTKQIPEVARGIVVLGPDPIIAVRSDGGDDVVETNVVCRRRRTILPELRVLPQSLLVLGFIPEPC